MSTPRRALLAILLVASVCLISGCSTPKEPAMYDIRFTTVAGTDESGEIAWLAANPVRWWITDRRGDRVVVVGTPCVGSEAAVAVTEKQIILDQSKMQIAAIFCEPPLGDYDRWVHEFTKLPLNYSWDEKTLILSN